MKLNKDGRTDGKSSSSSPCKIQTQKKRKIRPTAAARDVFLIFQLLCNNKPIEQISLFFLSFFLCLIPRIELL